MEWAQKIQINQDWITYIFFLNLIFIAFLNWKYKNQLNKLFNFFKIDSYANLYFNAQLKYLLHPFNIIGFFIILSSLNLWSYFVLESQESITLQLPEFFNIFLILVAVLSSRFILVEIIIQKIDVNNQIKQYLFKSFIYRVLIGILMLSLLVFYHYTNAGIRFLYTISGVCFFLWFLTQLSIILEYLKNNIKDFIYLIFYLCTINLAPWVWFYVLVLKPRL